MEYQVSKRDALRSLSAKFPAPRELKDIFDTLEHDAPRSVAIIAGAIIEGMLERIIISHLKDKEPNLIGRLFKNKGPLSDFDSKILIAHAFWIITPADAEDLHRIKSVRNAFAHATQKVTFDTPEILSQLKETISWNRILNDSEIEDHTKLFLSKMKGHDIFLILSKVYCGYLNKVHIESAGTHLIHEKDFSGS
jgi:DNA-binding MltR family transcriptional regulator